MKRDKKKIYRLVDMQFADIMFLNPRKTEKKKKIKIKISTIEGAAVAGREGHRTSRVRKVEGSNSVTKNVIYEHVNSGMYQ